VARERLGLDRGAISLRTKINERHLAAVEDSDFTALPARIYAVGFARSYAGAVGLDASAIAAQVRRELNEQESPGIARPAYDLDLDDPAKIPSRRLAWIAAAVVVGLIVAGAFFWRSYFVPAVDLPPVREVTASAVSPPELSPSAMISPTAESAAGAAGAGEPAADLPPAARAAASASQPRPSSRTSVSAAATAIQAPPSPVPERLQPQGAAQTQPEAAPSSAPAP